MQLALQASLRLSDSLSYHIPHMSIVVLVVPSLLLLDDIHSFREVSGVLTHCFLHGGANGSFQLQILLMVSLRLLLAELQKILLGLGDARVRLCYFCLQLIDVRIDHLGLAVHSLLGLNCTLVVIVSDLTDDSLAPKQHLLCNRLLGLRDQLCRKPVLHVALAGDFGTKCLSFKSHCTLHSSHSIHNIVHFCRQTRNCVIHDHVHLLLVVVSLQLVGFFQPPNCILQGSFRLLLELV
mmetsp:Transcript_27169/g.65374  ORF Transcript_27169/g.65374 Transcript_27169/m.65374 type:complete len:237 (-) Transcript_27169:1516-2226(-)